MITLNKCFEANKFEVGKKVKSYQLSSLYEIISNVWYLVDEIFKKCKKYLFSLLKSMLSPFLKKKKTQILFTANVICE